MDEAGFYCVEIPIGLNVWIGIGVDKLPIRVGTGHRHIHASKRVHNPAKAIELNHGGMVHPYPEVVANRVAQQAWTEAADDLNRLLRIDPENGNALFYLAQIAAQQQKHEEAVGYYLRAEASDTAQPWVKAWSAVRVGRYLAHQQKFDEARRKFEEVLALGDDLNGARRAAEESLSQLPPLNKQP